MNDHPCFRIRGVLGGVTAALIVAPPAGLAQELTPVVSAAFVVEAADFVGNYSPDKMRWVQDSVSVELARALGDYFRFLRWVPVSDTAQARQAKAHFTVSMVAKAGRFASTVSLRVSGSVGGDSIADPDPPVMPFYGQFDDQPTQDPERLFKDVMDTIAAALEGDDFRDRLQEDILRFIPLIDSIGLLPGDQQVTLPFRWEDLAATDESVLMVSFVSQPPDDVAKDGTMRLRLQGRLNDLAGQSLGVRLTIIRFDFPPHAQEGTNVWLSEIPTIIGQVLAESLHVFMERYVLDPNRGRSGRLITRLPGGGS